MFRRKNSEVEKNRELEESKETVTCAICVDYFEDARQLSCSHSFCLACLVSFQSDKHGSSPCPTCRKISVPPLAQLQSLPINSFANGLAELIRQQENPPTTIAGLIIAKLLVLRNKICAVLNGILSAMLILIRIHLILLMIKLDHSWTSLVFLWWLCRGFRRYWKKRYWEYQLGWNWRVCGTDDQGTEPTPTTDY